jgi:glucose/mannose-6-phosphate isomerase
MLCWHHVFPEMNHNELVGWETGTNDLTVVMLQSSADHERSRIRMNICKGIFEAKTSRVVELKAQGANLLEEIFYLIHFGDWVSLHLAELNGTDPIDIRNIDFLKNELAAIQ